MRNPIDQDVPAWFELTALAIVSIMVWFVVSLADAAPQKITEVPMAKGELILSHENHQKLQVAEGDVCIHASDVDPQWRRCCP